MLDGEGVFEGDIELVFDGISGDGEEVCEGDTEPVFDGISGGDGVYDDDGVRDMLGVADELRAGHGLGLTDETTIPRSGLTLLN